MKYAIFALAIVFVLGCERVPFGTGLSLRVKHNCSFCHGNEDNAAPPLSLDGSKDTGHIGVGAHQAHMQEGKVAKAVHCEECHIVPKNVNDPGHFGEGADGAHAKVVFGDLASNANLTPAWDREKAQCANIYCHGASLTGGKRNEPVWTRVDGSGAECDSCHGNPPPEPHIQGTRSSDCMKCHPGTVDENGNIHVAAGLHVNGKVDTATDCYSCHGKQNVNDAPPFALNGSEDISQIGVGAHQAHMQEGKVAKAIQCQECHIVPKNIDDPGHLPEGPDDTHAKVVFGTLAKEANLTPAWNRETAQCANTYCHGASLTGGKRNEPVWTRVDGSGAECDSCHGNPPPEPHIQGTRSSDCMKCHPGTVDENGNVNVAAGLHVNGKVDTATECYSCHGKQNVNDAPPFALNGSEDISQIGVGAHQAHMQEGKVAKAIQCQECHIVPKNIDDPGHLPGGPDDTHAKVVFGTLAKNANLTPAWNHETAQCANTYCHGASLTGGKHNEPVWTWVDENQAQCDSCHGNPPPLPHLQGARWSDCAKCHPGTVDENGHINVAGGLHIDGKIDTVTECYTCHGKEKVNAAPPLSLSGSEDTKQIGVGAHQAHMQEGKVAKAIQCQECHVVPKNVDDPGHLPEGPDDTHAKVVFGTLAKNANLTPAWNRETAQCADTYCHGASLTGGTKVGPTWTLVDGSWAACDSCHGNPPPLPHLQGARWSDCAKCHPGTVDENGHINVAGGLHIDGKIDTVTECYTCHGKEKVNAAPPLSLSGSEDTHNIGVGAHQTHMQEGKVAKAIQCQECHIVPKNVDDPGHLPEGPDDTHAKVVFGTLAKNANLTPAWNRETAQCANTYCHGASLTGGTKVGPTWTLVDGSWAKCDSCHGFPPPSPHYQDGACEMCHPRTVTSGQTINTSSGTHIDGETTFF